MDETDLLEPMAGPSSPPSILVDLLSLPVEKLDGDTLSSALATLGDTEVVETCIKLLTERPIDNLATARYIVDAGLARTTNVADEVEKEAETQLGESKDWTKLSQADFRDALNGITGENESRRRVLEQHVQLLRLSRRIDTYEAFGPSAEAGPSQPRIISAPVETENRDMEIDDPWAENEEEVPDLEDPWETGSTKSVKSVRSFKSVGRPIDVEIELDEPPISLSTFLADPLPDCACQIASSGNVKILGKVYERHREELWAYRFAILDNIPPWISPAELTDIGILPKFGTGGKEPSPESTFQTFQDHLDATPPVFTSISSTPARSQIEMRDWLIARLDCLDALGLLDIQLAWVQHGASLGIPDLDALGEELSLLSRLVYDANLSPNQQAEWSLSSWRKASPESIIKAYISNATQQGIVTDVRRLVLPYLYVLESKAERAGEPHTELIENHLHDIILDLPLHLALPLFEASKATIPTSERIIKNDLTVARLALACLYGSNERNRWSIMSSIFECLPVWDVSGGDIESDKEATSTTLDSIAAFVRPTRAGAHSPTAKDLFIFFAPLPFASLSRALDILDVHLESGEILARWDTPVQLRFLLQSAKNKEDQMELAEKMVRRQVGGQHSDARWTSLWGDIKKLGGGDDALLRGAFGVLSREDMIKIYLGGVIASGSEYFRLTKATRLSVRIRHCEEDDCTTSD